MMYMYYFFIVIFGIELQYERKLNLIVIVSQVERITIEFSNIKIVIHLQPLSPKHI